MSTDETPRFCPRCLLTLRRPISGKDHAYAGPEIECDCSLLNADGSTVPAAVEAPKVEPCRFCGRHPACPGGRAHDDFACECRERFDVRPAVEAPKVPPGPCGEQIDGATGPLFCRLLHGHEGWHLDDCGASWGERTPPVAVGGDDDEIKAACMHVYGRHDGALSACMSAARWFFRQPIKSGMSVAALTPPVAVAPSVVEEVARITFAHDYKREPHRTFDTAPETQRAGYLEVATAVLAHLARVAFGEVKAARAEPCPLDERALAQMEIGRVLGEDVHDALRTHGKAIAWLVRAVEAMRKGER